LTKDNIKDVRIYPAGLGTAPWEEMPTGEDDEIAQGLQNSLMGRLVPLSRFVLLADDGIHYTEGVAHKSHLEGVFDPSVAICRTEAKGKQTVRALWTDTTKRPWRNLIALLAFLGEDKSQFNCLYIQYCLGRGKNSTPKIGLWSGGLRLSSNAGEQYVSGTDDYVESEIIFNSVFFEKNAYMYLKSTMDYLDDISRILYGTVTGYYKELNVDGKEFAKKSTETFWQLCERKFSALLKACEDKTGKSSESMKPEFAKIVTTVYEEYCPRESARQIDAWAKHYPHIGGEYGKQK
jgi:CRISPR system Cascade subunit CasA